MGIGTSEVGGPVRVRVRAVRLAVAGVGRRGRKPGGRRQRGVSPECGSRGQGLQWYSLVRLELLVRGSPSAAGKRHRPVSFGNLGDLGRRRQGSSLIKGRHVGATRDAEFKMEAMEARRRLLRQMTRRARTALDDRNAAIGKIEFALLCPQLDGPRSYELAPVVSLTPRVLQLRMVAGTEQMQELSHPTTDLFRVAIEKRVPTAAAAPDMARLALDHGEVVGRL
jgi:hypothetical protein